MYGLFIAGAILVMLDVRIGLSENYLPKIIFTFSKQQLVWADIDLLPTFVGAALLFAAIIILSKKYESRFLSSAKTITVWLFVLSLLAFAQFSGQLIADLNTSSDYGVFNPGVISEIVYSIVDIVCYILSVVSLGFIVDGLSETVGAHENTESKKLLDNAVRYGYYFRTLCAIPVFIRAFLMIMNFDESPLLASITAAIYYISCVIPLYMFIRFVKNIRPAMDVAEKSE